MAVLARVCAPLAFSAPHAPLRAALTLSAVGLAHHVRRLDLATPPDDELLSRVDQPLKVATCAESGRKYLLCDYNRDGDSYRSPWSNKYEPALEEEGEGEGVAPTGAVRKLEVDANEVFDAYREL